MIVEHGPFRFRTLFISDVHLGARGCQADRLLDFLRYQDAGKIYLVGDIVDGGVNTVSRLHRELSPSAKNSTRALLKRHRDGMPMR